MRPATVNCPKCGRRLPPDGELAVGPIAIPFYVCPECIVRMPVVGGEMELPLMFIVGPNGEAINPDDPEGEIDLTPYD